jgi:hypothetical protein
MSKRQRVSKQEGSALLVVMLVCFVLGTVGAVGWQLAGSAAMRTRQAGKISVAVATAESGVSEMYNRLQSDPEEWIGKSFTNALGSGSYVVSATVVGSTIVVESTGTAAGVSQTTAIELLGDIDQGALQTTPSVFSGIYGILAGGDVVLETSAMDIHGAVHANGNIKSSEGNPPVHGNMTAVGSIEVTPQTGYTASEGSARVEVPEGDFFSVWKAKAQNGGIYVDGDYQIAKTTVVPGNGVVYVEGNVKIQNRSGLIGTLVAMGNITVDNQFTHTAYADDWPVMLCGGNIELYNRNNYVGLIYTRGNLLSCNRKQIKGNIIALGDVEIKNGCNLEPAADVTYVLDPDAEPVAETIAILPGGWIR